jgi:phosphoglycerol transferase MdoB-like AlkP superfamily enzyme
MFRSLFFFIRFFGFWLLFFAIERFIFLFIFHKKLRDIPLGEKLATFYHALRLDLSMAAYFAVVPILYFIFWYFSKRKSGNLGWLKWYNKTLIILSSFVFIVNFNTYREWGTKVNEKAVSFALESPKEAVASSASSPVFFSFTIFFLLIAIGFYLHFIFFKPQLTSRPTPFFVKIAVSISLFALNFLAIRGGLGVAPNSQSMAYFSKYEILNQASLNTEWNLISSLLASKKTHKNPYLYFEENLAVSTATKLFEVKKDSTVKILTTNRPNIVLFVLESFTVDLTKTLGNEDGITPGLDSMINHGVLFDHIYAAGNRTDKGLLGTLAGFPTLGIGSIVKWPEKMQKLPSISQKLFENNYKTSFYYGGESEFDNYKAFILSHGYQKLIDKNNFQEKDMNSKWGAYDALVFRKQLSEINGTKTPFFSTILSLTNHEPFELPVSYKFGNADIIHKFKSTAFYTDSCIRAYLIEAKKQAWYKNTLFIFIADHGHLYPKNKFEIFQPERYHIPIIFYGDVIKSDFKGKRINITGSQQDLASTLLHQLDIGAKDFSWSKNLLNPYTKGFAFFTWEEGFGFVEDKHCVTFDNIGKNILYNSRPKDSVQTNELLKQGKSYLQSAYQQFIKL